MAGDVKFNKWLNDDGTENSKIRAFVNFDGTTPTPTIRKSNNVIGITDNGVGDYTVNFDTPMPDANYAGVGMSDRVTTDAFFNVVQRNNSRAKTVSSYPIFTKNSQAILEDQAEMCIIILSN